jgi:hypothetical protein
MLSIFLCHAPEDGATAGELAAFLERGAAARVWVEEGRTAPGSDLIARVDEGRMADVILALVSEASWPRNALRAAWEPAFIQQPAAANVAVAVLRLDSCRFPEVLRRKNCFEMGPSPLAAFREIKRWVLDLRPVEDPPFIPAPPPYPVAESHLERLAEALADRPGTTAVADAGCALAFAARHAADFEAVFWASARDTETALAGELAACAGVPPGRPHAYTAESLRRLCAEHRFLVLLDGATADPLGLHRQNGLTSVLAINRAPVPLPAGVSDDETRLAAALAACGLAAEGAFACAVAGLDPKRGEAALAGLESRGLALRPDARLPRWLGLSGSSAVPEIVACHAVLAARGDDLAAARHAFRRTACVDAGRRAASLATAAGRLAEALEIHEALHRHAETVGDADLLQWAVRERCRILEIWEMFEESAALRRAAGAFCGTQLALF